MELLGSGRPEPALERSAPRPGAREPPLPAARGRSSASDRTGEPGTRPRAPDLQVGRAERGPLGRSPSAAPGGAGGGRRRCSAARLEVPESGLAGPAPLAAAAAAARAVREVCPSAPGATAPPSPAEPSPNGTLGANTPVAVRARGRGVLCGPARSSLRGQKLAWAPQSSGSALFRSEPGSPGPVSHPSP